jgi:hypothetical protein
MARLIHSADMRVTQTLASGITIRQDFRTAARFVFFDTGASNGNTPRMAGRCLSCSTRASPTV